MGKVIAVINRKGGVGKTTTTVALADAFISEFEKNVCVIDLDPQASATIALAGQVKALERAQAGEDMANALLRRMEDASSTTTHRIGMVNVIRGRATLALDVLNNSDAFWDFEQAAVGQGRSTDLSRVVGDIILEMAREYDRVLIDCPPGQSVASDAALRAADLILCPTTADRLSFWGLQGFGRYLMRVGPTLLEKSLFLVTRYVQKLVECRDTYNVLAGFPPPADWPAGNHPPPFPVLKMNDHEARGGGGDLVTIREATNFVKRLGVRKPRTFESIYGRAAVDVRRAAHAADRELSR